jgi:hypothetical protein
MSIMGRTTGGAVRIYQITYIVGFTFGLILHYTVNKFFPPPGLGIEEEFEDRGEVIEGVVEGSEGSRTPTKGPEVTDAPVLPVGEPKV